MMWFRERRMSRKSRTAAACIGRLSTALVLAAAMSSVQARGAILLGEWRLDEGAGAVAYDSSGNGYDGDILGAPTWIPGKSGTALRFDGVDDYIEIPNTTDWAFPDGLMLMASVRLDTNDPVQNDVAIVGNHISGNNTGYFLGVRDDRFNFLLASLPTNRIETADTWRDGLWHQVVGIFDAATGLQSLYVDGNLKAEQVTVPPYPDQSPASLRIGAYTEGQFANKFKGDIDEVRIYIPEPATLSLLLFGGVVALKRRR